MNMTFSNTKEYKEISILIEEHSELWKLKSKRVQKILDEWSIHREKANAAWEKYIIASKAETTEWKATQQLRDERDEMRKNYAKSDTDTDDSSGGM